MTKIADYRSIFLLPTRTWTLEDYHAMIEAGILTSEDRVELLFGQIVEMNPVGRAHSTTVKKINKFLNQRLSGDDFVIGIQDPVTLVDSSEPEPDVYVVKGPLEQYLDHHPGPEDILLLIEVSDSTLEKDKGAKKVNYAQAGIKEYWIIDVYARQILRYVDADPDTSTYLNDSVHEEGGTIDSLLLGSFNVNDLVVTYE